MDQNQMLLYIMVGGCGLCVLYGILKRPSYLLVLLALYFLYTSIARKMEFMHL